MRFASVRGDARGRPFNRDVQFSIARHAEGFYCRTNDDAGLTRRSIRERVLTQVLATTQILAAAQILPPTEILPAA